MDKKKNLKAFIEKDIDDFMDYIEREVKKNIAKVIRESASAPPLESNDVRRGYQEACNDILKILNK